MKELNAWPVSELAREITVEDLVDDYASVYAGYEQLSEMESEPFDSHELDHCILGHIYDYWGERRGEAIGNISGDYSELYKLRTLNLPISEIEELVKSSKYKSSLSISEIKELAISEKKEKLSEKLQKEVQNERSYSKEVQE